MRKLSEDEVKEVLFNMLSIFDKFCVEENLVYYLGGGTLLGAIRHEGFIPWDDDIDVMMPRKDYERFLTKFSQSELYRNSGISLRHYKNSHHHLHTYTQLLNSNYSVVGNHDHKYRKTFRNEENNFLYIDIFPIDGVPSKSIAQRVYFAEIYLYKAVILCATRNLSSGYSGRNRFIKILKAILFSPFVLFFRLFNVQTLLKRLDRINQRYNFETSEFVACTTGRYGMREVEEAKTFSDIVKVTFEGKEFNAPVGYNQYLVNHYGNYLILPPHNKRVTHFEGAVAYNKVRNLQVD